MSEAERLAQRNGVITSQPEPVRYTVSCSNCGPLAVAMTQKERDAYGTEHHCDAYQQALAARRSLHR